MVEAKAGPDEDRESGIIMMEAKAAPEDRESGIIMAEAKAAPDEDRERSTRKLELCDAAAALDGSCYSYRLVSTYRLFSQWASTGMNE